MTHALFAKTPLVVAALHLPDPVVEPGLSRAWLEDYTLKNAGVFAAAGVPAIKLQDQTRAAGPASVETIARTAALGRLLKREYPKIALGIIVQAHDAEAPLAIAAAAGADFVRLKVYVAAVVGAEGTKTALAPTARAYRKAIGACGVAILADVFDRTSIPLVDIPPERGALWAEQMGADGLVLTGSSFEDSLQRIASARGAGVKAPILLGGGATETNVAAALRAADGVVVSTALMRKGAPKSDPLRWDLDLANRFMDRVRAG